MPIRIKGAIFAITAALAIVGITSGLTNSVVAQEQKFVATLSGQEEVPPTNSQATGMADFTITGENAEYSVNASNMQGVTAGHIHSGKQGENGPIVVTLFKNDSPSNEVSETGSITADKLEGPMAGKQLTDLVTAMSNGTTYVNIHTEQNPNGEIRGQITSGQQ
jgi:CHRD domain-containing protein